MTRIYQCCTCNWYGSIDEMPVVQCPKCQGGYLQFVHEDDTPEKRPETLFDRRRNRDREAEMEKKTERKRPGLFLRMGDKLLFRREK